jgi:phage tail-like protein
MTTVVGEDPLIGYSFALDLSGKATGYFTEVSGIGSETEIVEQKVTDPAGHDVIKKIPGRLKFTDITLKRGITSSMDFYQWRKAVEDGQIASARINATITMYNQLGTAVARWNLTNAWPAKITGPSINAGSSEVGIEELTVTYDYLERVQ